MESWFYMRVWFKKIVKCKVTDERSKGAELERWAFKGIWAFPKPPSGDALFVGSPTKFRQMLSSRVVNLPYKAVDKESSYS